VATLKNAATGYNVTYSYTYDNNGNIKTVSDGTYTTTYTYDNQNQLTREDNQQANKSWTWTYDDAGNILSKKEYAYTTGTLGTAQSTKSYTYGNSNWGDLLTAYNGNTISSDAIGNMTNDGTWTYTWEHGRELATMSSGGTTWTYTYDADGMRTKRTTGSSTYTYTYIGGQLSYMNADGMDLYITYDASGQPMTVNYGGGTYYYVTNLQGDVTVILNNVGTMVVSYTYDAWGNVLSVSGPMATNLGVDNPLRYRSYVYDPETGLYYLQSRYYNPALGRFINSDVFATTGQGLLGNNMFAYCCNTPVSTYDPSGCLMVPADPYKGGPTGPGSTTSQKGSIGYVSKGTIKQNVDEYVNKIPSGGRGFAAPPRRGKLCACAQPIKRGGHPRQAVPLSGSAACRYPLNARQLLRIHSGICSGT